MAAPYRLPSANVRSVVGLGLAAVIAGSWLGLHAYAMFVFEPGWSNLGWALLMSAILCWLSVGVFIVSHDAMHGSLAPGRPGLNGFIGGLLLFLYAGFAWKKMRAAHFDHHKFSGRDSDPDFDAANPGDFRRWYATFLRRYFGWRSIAFVFTIVALYWLVIGVPMAQIVLLYGLPAIASSLQLFYFGTYRPHRHDPHRQDGTAGFADEHNARSNDMSILASLASCFHFGYHLEHHRRPDVPWWALPGARRAKVAA